MASAAILAGGRARRFGGLDKSTLAIGDSSILEHQIRELAKIADDILLVGPRSTTVAGTGVRIVADRYQDCGPLGGLDAALAEARDDVIVLVACDMPFVTAPLLGHLLGLAAEAQAVVPRTERGYHPLCAAYSRTCREAVTRRLEAHQLSMVGLLEEVRVRIVGLREIERFGAADRLLANVNTPAQFDAIETHLGHKL
jgi:molybdopterin-guanine dinucleotide biosynthesis protein A